MRFKRFTPFLLLLCLLVPGAALAQQFAGFDYEAITGRPVGQSGGMLNPSVAVAFNANNGGEVLYAVAPGDPTRPVKWYFSNDSAKTAGAEIVGPDSVPGTSLVITDVIQLLHLFGDYYFALAQPSIEAVGTVGNPGSGTVLSTASLILVVRLNAARDSVILTQWHLENYLNISAGPYPDYARPTYTKFSRVGDTLLAFRRPVYSTNGFGSPSILVSLAKVSYIIESANGRIVGATGNVNVPRQVKDMRLDLWNTRLGREYRLTSAAFTSTDRAVLAMGYIQNLLFGQPRSGDLFVLKGTAPNDTLFRTDYNTPAGTAPDVIDAVVEGTKIAFCTLGGGVVYSEDYGTNFVQKANADFSLNPNTGTYTDHYASMHLQGDLLVGIGHGLYIDTLGIDTASTTFLDDKNFRSATSLNNRDGVLQTLSFFNRGLFVVGGTDNTLGRFVDRTKLPAAPCPALVTASVSGNRLSVPAAGAAYPNATYTWQDCNTNATVSTGSNTFTPTYTGQFRCVIVYNSTCTTTTGCSFVTVTSVDPSRQGAFGLYPNPVADVLTLSFATPAERTLTILNTRGEVVRSLNLPATLTTEVNVADLSSGLYLARVGAHTVRFVRQ